MFVRDDIETKKLSHPPAQPARASGQCRDPEPGFGSRGFVCVPLAGRAGLQIDIGATGPISASLTCRRAAPPFPRGARTSCQGRCPGAIVVRRLQNMLSARRASSDMRLMSQGGSNVRFTLAPLTPGTPSTAFSTQIGISPATGHPGAVRVMSMVT